MPYSAGISRVNPTCFLFLIDQSGSMAEGWGGDAGKTKAQGVADAINRLLQTLVRRCAKGEYVVDRYFIGAVGYGGQPGDPDEVSLGFPAEALAASIVQPVSMIKSHPLRIEDRIKNEDNGAGGLIQKHTRFPVWFSPKAKGKTPMCAALRASYEVVCQFIGAHPGCFPPIIINITDGMDYARLLFHMSSPLPPSMLRQAQIMETSVEEGAVGFAFNADLASVIMFLDIGTRADQGVV